jgi:hypothetical protein
MRWFNKGNNIIPPQLLQGFCDALVKADWRKAYSFTSSYYQRSNSIDDMRAQNIEAATGGIYPTWCSMSVESVNDPKNRAKGSLKIRGVLAGRSLDGRKKWSHPVEYDIPVDFIKEDDGWKIDGFGFGTDVIRRFLD